MEVMKVDSSVAVHITIFKAVHAIKVTINVIRQNCKVCKVDDSVGIEITWIGQVTARRENAFPSRTNAEIGKTLSPHAAVARL